MKTDANPRQRTAVLNYFSLFTSVSTLFCCALPSALVLLGLGASVASFLSFLPWLVTMSKHKAWTFGISGILIALSFLNMHYFAPRLAQQQCFADDPSACSSASRLSKVVLWFAAGLYVTGFLVAYVLGPILAAIDRSAS
jgi:mercuric ion transport protein